MTDAGGNAAIRFEKVLRKFLTFATVGEESRDMRSIISRSSWFVSEGEFTKV